MSVLWNRVTIVGCGLIGASFALGLRRHGACEQIAGWDVSGSVLHEAVAAGLIDEVDQAFAGESVSASDLIYLAMPVGGIIEFLRERASQLKAGAVITDAGSTKVEICRAARLHLTGAQQFVGGHPVAGSHLQGLAHARADLFVDSPYVLVPDEEIHAGRVYRDVKETLELLGANVTTMTAVDHDRAMAFVSHVPQIVSSALAAVTNDQSDAEALVGLSGAGYRDMTRLASSSWSMWGGILTTNSSETVAALNALLEKLTSVRDELRDPPDRGGKLNLMRSLFRETGPA
jgi:prephenate dehydrogenase